MRWARGTWPLGATRDAVWAVPVVAASLVLAALLLHARSTAVTRAPADVYIADLWSALLFPVAGARLVTRRPARPVGHPTLACAALAVVGLASGIAAYDAADGVLTGLGHAATWVNGWLWTP